MEENEYFRYLDQIHATEVLNKFELAPLLMGHFPDLDRDQAYTILEAWIIKRLRENVD